MAAYFEYHAPETWEEAITLLNQYGTDAQAMAGGTDLMVRLERQQIAPKHIVSLDRIPGWDTFRVNDTLLFSAGTTFRQLERARGLDGKHAALVEAARQMGGVQIRNVATVAGNLCNASPAADAVPPLLVMGAALTLLGPEGERIVPADQFIIGPGKTVLAGAEVLRQIHVPALPQRTATTFLKAGRRRAMEISVVCVAVRLTLAQNDDTCRTARIALGAVAPTPMRAKEAEQRLEGPRLTPEALTEAAHLAAAATSPISDVRASAEYRRHLAETMVRRGLEQCLRRIGGEAL